MIEVLAVNRLAALVALALLVLVHPVALQLTEVLALRVLAALVQALVPLVVQLIEVLVVNLLAQAVALQVLVHLVVVLQR